MDQAVISRLSAHLAPYVASKCPLRAFEGWFASNLLWPIEELTDDSETVALIYEIDRRLSQLGEGMLTERELKKQFFEILRRATAAAPAYRPRQSTGRPTGVSLSVAPKAEPVTPSSLQDSTIIPGSAATIRFTPTQRVRISSVA